MDFGQDDLSRSTLGNGDGYFSLYSGVLQSKRLLKSLRNY